MYFMYQLMGPKTKTFGFFCCCQNKIYFKKLKEMQNEEVGTVNFAQKSMTSLPKTGEHFLVFCFLHFPSTQRDPHGMFKLMPSNQGRVVSTREL